MNFLDLLKEFEMGFMNITFEDIQNNEPEDFAEDNETIFSTVKEEERKIFVMVCRLTEQLQAQEEYPDPILMKKCEILRSLFWHTIYEQMDCDILREHGIGIRKGWKIVMFNKQECPPDKIFVIPMPIELHHHLNNRSIEKVSIN